MRWGFSVDVGSRYHIDTIRPGDSDRIGAVLDAVGHGEWWAVSRTIIAEHPELAGVARDRNGNVGGYFISVTPASAPAVLHDDIVLGRWLEHARHVLQTTSAVLWREAIDLTGEMGEVTSLLGAGGIIGSGTEHRDSRCDEYGVAASARWATAIALAVRGPAVFDER